jgi:hypothetical protein
LLPVQDYLGLSESVWRMKRILYSITLVLLAVVANAAPFTAGDLAVLQVGDGTAALGNSSTALFIKEFSTAGSLVQTITIPTAGGTQIACSGSASSEGALTLSADRSVLTFAGYAASPGVAGIASTAAATYSRAVGVLSARGTFSRVATGSSAFDGNNVRNAVSDGQNYWLAGTASATGNSGIWCSTGGGTPVQVSAGNYRSANIVNGNLAVSTSSGSPGVYGFPGLPTSTATSSLLFAVTGGTPSPYDFALSPDGAFAYVADDRSGKTYGGIERWNLSAGVWTMAYNLASGITANDGMRQIAVDFSGANPVIYGTTAEASANRLVEVTDAGAGSAFTVLATADANTVYRGVDFTPSQVPEPSALVLLGLGSLLLVSRRASAMRP